MKSLSKANSGTILASISIIGAACVVAASANAQTTLAPGNVISGQVAQGKAACWLLPTTPGSRWRLQLDGDTVFIAVGRGSCEAFVKDKEDWNGAVISRIARIDFASGGGTYVVKGQGFMAQAVAYTLHVDQVPGVASSGRLPPGSAIQPWFAPGWTPESVSTFPPLANEGLQPGNIFKDCQDICPEMVVIPSGSFTMGSPADEVGRSLAEGPRHSVALVNSFAIGRYEVTFEEYDACVADGGCTHQANDQGWGRRRRPVVDVSWDDAQAYVLWLSKKTGHRYALPSEAEWEYAARAGTSTPWHTGVAILIDDANILNAFGKTVNVGGYPPYGFGLHDMHGNVEEWTLDCMVIPPKSS